MRLANLKTLRHGIAVAAVFLPGALAAQIVTVDPAATADGVTVFNTIQDAVLSFDIGTGSNAADTAPNIVEVVAFGPFDEVIPAVFGDDVSTGGAIAKIVLTDDDRSDNTVTIRGKGVKPLLLVQYAYSFAALTARGTSGLVIENAVIAQSTIASDEAASGQRFIGYAIDGGQLTFDGCVITALPAEAATYTSLSDIPAGVLDGSAALTDTYVYPANFAGRSALAATNPPATEGNDPSTVHLRDTVVTQWGNNSSALYAQNGAHLNVTEGTVLSNNARGIFIRPGGGARPHLTINGTYKNRVRISNNNFGNDWINIEDAGNVSISDCNFIGRPNQNCIRVITGVESLSITESIFADGERGTGGSTAVRFDVVPGSLTLDELTIIDHRYAFITNTFGFSGDNALTITNSILGNRTSFANGIVNVVNAINCAFPASGPVAVTNPPFELTVNEIDCIYDDPEFSGLDYGNAGFAIVRSAAYATAAQGGAPLDGGGAYVPAGIFSTVTVDKNDPKPNGISTFDSIQAAMLSFDAFSEGPNSTVGEPVTINITSFGPYDEVLAGVFEADTPSGGIRTKIPQSMSPLTIRGEGVKPLILPREVYNWAGISVRGPVEVVMENVVIAPSVTLPPSRYLAYTIDGGKASFKDSTITTLPASAASAASIDDLPSWIHDGMTPFEGGGVQAPANGGRGILVAQGPGSEIEVMDSIITQCGYKDAEYWPLLAQNEGTVRLLEGTVVANNSSGVYVRDAGGIGGNLVIQGTAGNRVFFHNNNYQGRGWIFLGPYTNVSIEQADFYGAPQDQQDTPDGRPNSVIYVANAGSNFSISECTLIGGQRTNPGGTNAFTFAVAPTTLSMDNLTIAGHRYGIIQNQMMIYTISDSIFSNVHYAFANNNSVVNAMNCAFQASGPGAITGIGFDTIVNESGSIYADPQFTSLIYGEEGYAQVTNPLFAAAASDGSPLDGGGSFLGGVVPSVGSWFAIR
jgi:hypothetical protein